jgi:dolichol-phosphate mannosyltransferase
VLDAPLALPFADSAPFCIRGCPHFWEWVGHAGIFVHGFSGATLWYSPVRQGGAVKLGAKSTREMRVLKVRTLVPVCFSPSNWVILEVIRNNEKSMPTLSVIIPAFNEEANIENAVINIRSVVSKYFSDWELLVFDDGSSDHTGAIADEMALSDPKIRVIHHLIPHNLGGCYKEGLRLASKEFLIMVPGDNECGVDVMERIFKLVGRADMIIPYTENPEVRPVTRRILSRAFVFLVNALTGNHLSYYNGAVLHTTAIINSIEIHTDSFGYQAEALVKLLKAGHSYLEVGTKIDYRPSGVSKALRPNNILTVARFLSTLSLESRMHSHGAI